jgi:preprotein translocase subunit SecE
MAEVRASPVASAKDTALITLSVLLALFGIVGFYWYDEQALAVRIGMVVLGLVAGAALAWFSWYGREFWQFALAARIELRKVVWPSRDETVKTTYVVFIFAIVMGLFFWGLDWILTWLTRLLTGQSA